MAKKSLPIETLGAVLEQSLKRLDLEHRLDEYAVWPIWNEVVGAVIARNAQPEKIRHGTLFVKVSSPVWMQQLQFMKDLIVEKLNQRLRAEVVKNIFFFVGAISSTDVDPDPDLEPLRAPPGSNDPIDERFLDEVADPEIRQAFKKMLRSYARRKQRMP